MAPDLIPATLGIVHTREADQLPVQEGQVRDVVVRAQGFEHRAPVVEQPTAVTGAQRLLHGRSGGNREGDSPQPARLLVEERQELVLDSCHAPLVGGVLVPPFLGDQEARRSRHQQDARGGQREQQARHDGPSDRLHAAVRGENRGPHDDDEHQQYRHRGRGLRGDAVAPVSGIDVHRQHGDATGRTRPFQRHERGDPRAPPVRLRPLDGREPGVEHRPEGPGGFVVGLAGRRVGL